MSSITINFSIAKLVDGQDYCTLSGDTSKEPWKKVRRGSQEDEPEIHSNWVGCI
jgi:hypothetical protein